ncbi:DUF1311 domain-containing protein [Rhodobacterales bacterium HKCCE2091]|nr:DUF1311 domain-containing protein [Rhodobacterales bacterium HKCCE2091]
MRALGLIFILWPLAAAAQDVPFDPAPTETCIGEATAGGLDPAVCVGRSANACQRQQGGDTTIGIVGCLGGERDFWQGRLDIAYDALLSRRRDFDASIAGDASSAGRYPSTAAALAEQQALWEAWRDALCRSEWAPYADGTIRGPINANCQMRETAAQALRLQRYLEEM